jgi:hypothetical protein
MKTNEKATKDFRETEPEELVSVYVPSDGTGAFLEGALNGVSFRIPTDKVVEVPRRIADIIAESRRGIAAGSRAVEAYMGAGGRRIG